VSYATRPRPLAGAPTPGCWTSRCALPCFDARPPTLLRLHAAGSTGFGHDLLQLQRSDIAGLLLPGVTGIAEICAVSSAACTPCCR
jgi:citrate lyase beta subunit